MLMVIIKPILTALVSFRVEHIQKEIKYLEETQIL